MTIAHVVLYAQKPGWLFCDRTEEFFRGNGVEFDLKNVWEYGEAMAELERLGTMITPVTATEGMALRVGDATSGSGSTASSP
jgi:hypothetical protein